MNIASGITLVILLYATSAMAQPASRDIFINFQLDRTHAGAPVHMRAILVKPVKSAETALLIFRGNPGYARLEGVRSKDRNMVAFIRQNEGRFIDNGIAPVIMDCPTDQWGEMGGPGPTNCFDNYRASKTHADDVRHILAILRNDHGYKNIYILGHSQGTVSSRWLALNLGNEITGSIHSSAINVPNPRGYAKSMTGFAYKDIATPILHIHNEKDPCSGTPYGPVKAYAGDNLITVRGGIAQGEPCREGYHGHQGNEDIVGGAIIAWIKNRETPRFIQN